MVKLFQEIVETIKSGVRMVLQPVKKVMKHHLSGKKKCGCKKYLQSKNTHLVKYNQRTSAATRKVEIELKVGRIAM